jgi:carbamoyltransferase
MRILAFNIAHDSSVCSINNGEIEFFCKEERLSRVKRDKHPFSALDLYHSLNFGPIDHALYLTPTNNEPDIEIVYKTYIKKKFNVDLENFSALLHHNCHASLAYHNSRFKQCLVFVVDRNGSLFFSNGIPVAREAESIFLAGNGSTMQEIYKSFWLFSGHENNKAQIKKELEAQYPTASISINNSLSIVKVYEAATTLINQPALENGKTMGLSSYGKNKKYDPLFVNNFPISELFSHINNEDNTTCFFGDEDKITKNITVDNYHFYADKAKHVQLETQTAVLNLIKRAILATGIKNVCLVGGYGLNVVANSFYIKNLPDVNFYFEPVADDTGVPVGAAMIKHTEVSKLPIIPPVDNFYHYVNVNEPLLAGNTSSIEEICSLLIDQKSVAIFDGSPEAGPRALGHRSILFDPRNIHAKDIVNTIKKREWYRPFAGIILKSKFDEYFNTLGVEESKFMTIKFDAKPGVKEYVPGIIHVDNTCRIQTVSEGFLFELLTMFYEKTGCPMLLNTSFNLAGEALVQTKADAIDTLNNCTLDAVYFVNDNRLKVNNVT